MSTVTENSAQQRNVTGSIDELIDEHARVLSSQLHTLRSRLFSPATEKELRLFSSPEAARLIGVTDAYLRQLARAGEGPEAERGPGGRRLYSLPQINQIRRLLSQHKPAYLPGRAGEEHLQVIAVTNFKGGSGKTTVSVHLAQYLAMRGYRVLAVDLDPQASLSALFGYQPEFDIRPNETLYGAIRYDDQRRPLRDIIRSTYFDGLDLVPANLELHEYEHETPLMLTSGERSDGLFFARVAQALGTVDQDYDVVVIDCPPQLGFLTLGALCAATGVLITIHPQMLDVASMSQFLQMTAGLLGVVRRAGGNLEYDFLRYCITRFEPNDGPQAQVVGFLRNLFGDQVLTQTALKTTAVTEAGLRKQTIYEISRDQINRQTYERALESFDLVNGEIENLIRASWRRAG